MPTSDQPDFMRLRRLHRASLAVWPALLLFWLTGLVWMGLHSVVCWSGDEASAWWCWWAFALPLLPGAAALAAFATVLATLARIGAAVRMPSWPRRIRSGYRNVPPELQAAVRRCFFGAATALGWLAGAWSYSYLQLTLLAWLIGIGATVFVLLLNRLWLQDGAGPLHAFGIEVPPHRRWPVAWYNPAVLFQAAREWASSADMLRNADPRDALAKEFVVVDLAATGTDEGFWFDFISDTGDSGNATYTVARAALAEQLSGRDEQGQPHDTRRGRLLLLGGDLAYPGASHLEYAWRFFELFEAARPSSGIEQRHRTVLAIPQNHDWFDSASTFRRYFVNRNRGEFIGADTPQESSYFAARLPLGWWVLGLDFALAGDIDRGQLEIFRRLIGKAEDAPDERPLRPRMEPGAQVILIYPEPYWTQALGGRDTTRYPLRYQRLEADLERAGMHVRLRLAGDLHHYLREWHGSEPERLLITCGSGGAFLHPTHGASSRAPKAYRTLDNEMAIDGDYRHAQLVGSVDTLAPDEALVTNRKAYPPPEVSRSLAWRNLFSLFKLGNNRLPGRGGEGFWRGNAVFVGVLGLLYWLAGYTNSLVFSPSFADDRFPDIQAVGTRLYGDFLWDWFRALFYSPPALGVFGLLLLLCISVAKDEPSRWVRLAWPALHFLCHYIAAATLFWWLAGAVERSWVLLIPDPCGDACSWKWITTAFARGLLMFACGALAGGLIAGAYFALMAWFGWLPNNAYSPLAVEDYKGFLRFHIDTAGTLHGRFFACDRVPRRWKARGPTGDTRPAWVEADPRCSACWRVADTFSLKKREP